MIHSKIKNYAYYLINRLLFHSQSLSLKGRKKEPLYWVSAGPWRQEIRKLFCITIPHFPWKKKTHSRATSIIRPLGYSFNTEYEIVYFIRCYIPCWYSLFFLVSGSTCKLLSKSPFASALLITWSHSSSVKKLSITEKYNIDENLYKPLKLRNYSKHIFFISW